jgi:pentatricopeptide repeat protein
VLTPLAKQSERIGGSRAQHDLIEFTLLKACLNAGRLEEARQVLSARKRGVCGVAVEGVEALY